MLLDAMMTPMVANGGSHGKVHDGTPGRDCTYQQDTDEDAEGEERKRKMKATAKTLAKVTGKAPADQIAWLETRQKEPSCTRR